MGKIAVARSVFGARIGEKNARNRLGPELDGAKPWRGQCSGPGAARKEEMGPRSARKMDENFFCPIGIQRGRLAPKVRGIEACLGPELDGEKLWRGQCSGPTRTRWGKAVARSVLGARSGEKNGNAGPRSARKIDENFFCSISADPG